jgi:hypothetical protein
MEKLTETCTCDDHVDDPCPRHRRENELQDAVLRHKVALDALIEAAETARLELTEHGFVCPQTLDRLDAKLVAAKNVRRKEAPPCR